MAATALAQELVTLLTERGLTITTAESCTGGLVAAAITDISGSSAVFERGIISYANSAKMELLGVREATLAAHGAVSGEVAQEMAEGARKEAGADVAVSITGIAGPTGGTAHKPVGLVFIGVGTANITGASRHQFSGNRQEIRQQAVLAALERVITTLRLSGNTPI